MPKLGSKKEETHKKAEEQENCDSVQRLISLNLLPPQPGAAAPRHVVRVRIHVQTFRVPKHPRINHLPKHPHTRIKTPHFGAVARTIW